MPEKDTVKHFPVSWEELHRHAKALAWRMAEKGPWQGIVAVTRGGLVPAAIIARELDIRLIDTVCISSYDHQNQREARVLKGFEGDGEGWLIIDDLVDTGKTAAVLREDDPQGPFRDDLRQAGRASAGGHLHHGSQPGHLDLLPVGRRTSVHPADRPAARRPNDELQARPAAVIPPAI